MSSNNQKSDDGRNARIAGNDGKRDGFSLISDDKLIALYTNLLKCRMVGQRLGALSDHRSSNGTSSLWRGHEAGTVGVAIDLTSDDTICSPDHGLVTGFQKDSPIEAILLLSGKLERTNGSQSASGSQPRSRTDGIAPGTENRTHTQAAIGAALANKTRKNGRIAVVFGDGTGSELLNEALEIASQHTLPMIFVSSEGGQPNLAARASQSSRSKQSKSKQEKSKQPGESEIPWFPNIAVDKDDVVAVYRVANEAISRARLGRGPTLIECQRFHVNGIETSNGNGRHMRDPIANMENYLRTKGLFQPGLRNEIVGNFTKQLDSTLSLRSRESISRR
jgi:pyruvate dehydrogenase E1 component alpha subunit